MKTFDGKIVSLKMDKTAVIEVTRCQAHPLYKKLLKVSKKYKVEKGDKELQVGARVKIAQTKPVAKGKYFKVVEVIK